MNRREWLLSVSALTCQAAEGPFYRVSGKVVHSVSGAPLARARLRLSAQEDRQGGVQVDSAADGSFLFTRVPAGKYSLTAERNQFQRQSYQQKNLQAAYSSAVVVGEGQQTESLVFRMLPGAAVYGFVREANGDPVPWATVQAWRMLGHGESRYMKMAGWQYAKDDGSYRIYGLPAGRYMIVAFGKPWYSREYAEKQFAYPLTYAPGPVDLVNGGQSEAMITVQAAQVSELKLQFEEKLAGGSYNAMLGVESPEGAMIPLEIRPRQLSGNPASAGAVTEGQYLLVVGRMGGGLVAVEQIRVTAGMEPIPVRTGAAVEVKGRVSWPGVVPKSETPMIVLLKDRRGLVQLPAQVRADGRFEFPPLPADRYRLELYRTEPVPIRSITPKGASYADGWLALSGDGTAEVEVVADPDVADVPGIVEEEGRGQAGVMVVLVRAGAEGDESTLRMDQSDSDGTFRWRGVSPGEYLAFAFVVGDEHDWNSVQALKPWIKRAQRISVKGKAAERVRLTPTTG